LSIIKLDKLAVSSTSQDDMTIRKVRISVDDILDVETNQTNIDELNGQVLENELNHLTRGELIHMLNLKNQQIISNQNEHEELKTQVEKYKTEVQRLQDYIDKMCETIMQSGQDALLLSPKSSRRNQSGSHASTVPLESSIATTSEKKSIWESMSNFGRSLTDKILPSSRKKSSNEDYQIRTNEIGPNSVRISSNKKQRNHSNQNINEEDLL